jgi:hypothetical protein
MNLKVQDFWSVSLCRWVFPDVMKAVRYFETSVTIYPTKQHHIPGDLKLQQHRSRNEAAHNAKLKYHNKTSAKGPHFYQLYFLKLQFVLYVSTFCVTFSKVIIFPSALTVSSPKREMFHLHLIRCKHNAEGLQTDQNQFPLRIVGFVSNISHCICFVFSHYARDNDYY